MPKVLKAHQYKELNQFVVELVEAHPEETPTELRDQVHEFCMTTFGVSPTLNALGKCIYVRGRERRRETSSSTLITSTEDGVLKALKSGKVRSVIELANTLNTSPKMITEALDSLDAKGYNVDVQEDETSVKLDRTQLSHEPFRKLHLRNYLEGEWQKFGIVSDTHLCSVHERLDVVNALYDIFADEGISKVFLPGNYIDGEAKFNRFELKVSGGFGKQMQYFCEQFPQRSGIKTYYIDGDEHEGWYYKREGIVPGQHLEYMAKDMGREDLVYLGYLEADVAYEAPDGKTIIRLFHPKRGTAYAVSYSTQKIVESYQGGEKPEILLVGHFHKAEYMPTYRNIHIIQAGCCQDQSTFMRGKSIEAHVGGWIIYFKQRPDGSVCRLRAEFIGFYDRKYHITHEFSEEEA